MINLYGSLARAFEKKYQTSAKNIQINVRSASEMMKAMEANFNGFRAMLKRKGYYRLSRGESLVDGKSLSENDVEMIFSDKKWHLMPVAAGCKKGGVVKAILGVVLVVVGVVLNYFGQGWAGGPLIKMGIGMIVGGVAQMLSPSPSATDYGANEKQDERRSYLFSGPTNVVEPGTTIPVVYGEVFVGSIAVSGGLTIDAI